MDNEKLRLCREKIEHSLNWGTSEQWNNQDFENLSERIFAKTQVRLSVSTLRRIWGKVRYDSSPTMATLNVLAQYLDFESWRAFEHQQTVPAMAEQLPETNLPTAVNSQRRRTFRILASAFIVISVLAIAFILIKGKSADEPTVVFKSHKVTDDLPNSVVFDYDVSAFHSDSVYIQQSWDRHKRKRVSPTGKQHTSIYYYPGYFEAKLIVDGEVKKEDVVFIKTKGWKGMLRRQNDPIYLSESEIRLKGSLGVRSVTMREKLGSPVFNKIESSFSNVREFGVNGSDFVFETSLKNTSSVEESLCRQVLITLLVKGGAILVPLGAKGCVSELNVSNGTHWTSGKEHDLSVFGSDFDKFEKIGCRAKGGKFEVYRSDLLIFEDKQEPPIGDIVGIRISFEGAGEIQYVKLSAGDRVAYEERFDGAEPLK